MTDDDPQKTKQELYGSGDKEPSRFQSAATLWVRRIIIGLLLMVMAVALVWFVLIGPRAAQITQLEGELADAQSQIATLEAQVEELEALKPQRDVQSLLADAHAARFELQRSRVESAAAALLNSGRTIRVLADALGSEYEDTIDDLEARLTLAKEDIAEGDRFAALSDLEVYVNILTQLLRSLQ